MNKKKFLASRFVLFAAALVVGLSSVATPSVAKGPGGLPDQAVAHIPVCPKVEAGDGVHCYARVVTDKSGQPAASATPAGYGPTQLRGGYGITGSGSGSQVVAIVDAYNDPNILSDLNTYSSQYGIPQMQSCPVGGSATCFQKVDQRGGTSYPSTNAGWALEISLDVEVVHAMCPSCSILLVEADSNSFANLMAAEDRAFAMGAKVISNSYGGSEFSGETAYDTHFNHPGVAITVSSGDAGYGVEYPAASPYVTAVGGTTLNLSGNSYFSEAAWSGAGSGCSAFENKPAFQTDGGCAKRTVADVSAVADPNTGAAVYDSVRYQGRKGWFKVGGTSLSAPLIAAVYALGGVGSGVMANTLPYGHTGNLHDITSGSNGSCGGSYLCTAVAGYDGPTGLGSPSGSAAF